jgi:nicotinate-nucleotide adenylyltransferase
VGHLICAQEAHAQFGLDLVMFVPIGEAPHREMDQDPGVQPRLWMCECAVDGDPRFQVSRIEADREGPSYTVETLRMLRQRSPAHELTLILGADQASQLAGWHEPERVLSLVRVAVAAREGMERESVLREVEGLAGHERIGFFEMPRVDISSTLVRERAASGRPIRYLVPDGVADYIVRQSLYGAPVSPAGAVPT